MRALKKRKCHCQSAPLATSTVAEVLTVFAAAAVTAKQSSNLPLRVSSEVLNEKKASRATSRSRPKRSSAAVRTRRRASARSRIIASKAVFCSVKYAKSAEGTTYGGASASASIVLPSSATYASAASSPLRRGEEGSSPPPRRRRARREVGEIGDAFRRAAVGIVCSSSIPTGDTFELTPSSSSSASALRLRLLLLPVLGRCPRPRPRPPP